MGFRKWLMKQQWRIVQIRGIWSLMNAVLLLAYAYYAVFPIFADMEMVGPFAFAFILLIMFLFIGYLYDRVFVMWAPSQEVSMERNPFQYVPGPKDQIFWLPMYSTILDSVEMIAKELEADTTAIRDAKEYFAQIQNLSPLRKEDLSEAIRLRDEFIKKHPFEKSKANKS